MLTAALLALFCAAMGGGVISHTMFTLIAASISILFTPDLIHAAALMWCIVVGKILDTSVLLHANDGDKTCILKAVKRNMLILPAMLVYPFAGVMLMQAGWYYYVGMKSAQGQGVRRSEWLTGLAIGGLA